MLAPAVLSLAGPSSPAAAQQSRPPMTIGYVLPYAGDLAWYGEEIGRGYDLAILKVNADGGIREQPIAVLNEAGATGVTAFAKAYQAAYGHPPPSGHPLAGYAAMLALADAMNAAGGDDPDAVGAAARKMDKPLGSYPNGAGVKFTEWGRNERAPVSGFQWQGGKMMTIWPAGVANAAAVGPLVPWDKR